ncbi:MAG: TlpA family protein disulfide reductase [alpha proteobacterium HIMB114]|nr:MAG: TlpA family protein disulfide reductase [alpha proteobacterium HIMB114]
MFRNILSLIIIFFILNTNNTYSQPNILKTFNNIVLHEKPKNLPDLELINKKGNTIIFNDFSSKLTLINFWATWCAPCKKELPELDNLYQQIPRSQVNIVLINIENIKYDKIEKFFNKLKVKNLVSHFDNKLKLTKELKLRGIPITLIVNSDGKEMGRIIGDLNFTNPFFVSWINAQ